MNDQQILEMVESTMNADVEYFNKPVVNKEITPMRDNIVLNAQNYGLQEVGIHGPKYQREPDDYYSLPCERIAFG